MALTVDKRHILSQWSDVCVFSCVDSSTSVSQHGDGGPEVVAVLNAGEERVGWAVYRFILNPRIYFSYDMNFSIP